MAGVPHLVYTSVVGVDRIPVESSVDRVVADSGLPWTTLRAGQFDDLLVTRQLARLPLIPLPAGYRFRPVVACEAATLLLELTLGTPTGLVPDMAGSKEYSVAELLRGYLRASHQHQPIIPVWLPGKTARAFRAGTNLVPGRAVGRRTWEEFLADRVSSWSDSRSRLP